MNLLLDTSTSTARLTVVNGDASHLHEWQADRRLAKGLLGWIETCAQEEGYALRDVTGIGIMRGPGSFTGIRIGLTLANTFASELQIPIVGAIGDRWQDEVMARLLAGEDDKLVLPHYDRDANITSPRK